MTERIAVLPWVGFERNRDEHGILIGVKFSVPWTQPKSKPTMKPIEQDQSLNVIYQTGLQARAQVLGLKDRIKIDGVVGPATLEYHKLIGDYRQGLTPLRAIPAVQKTPSSQNSSPYEIMLSMLGTREVPGVESDPVLRRLFDAMGFKGFDDSALPWCGVIMGYCHVQSGYSRSELPKTIEMAQDWANFGRRISHAEVRSGDIVVYWRGKTRGWQGHVGFFVSWDGPNIRTLGGNQSDRVSMVTYDASKLIGFFRGPKEE